MQPFGENTVNTPAFLGKLWKMVNDPSTDHLICWSPSGTSFIIQNQAQFWYELLPLYYKHNNMSSFVRQLNMYGFHKMSTVENGTMDADKDEIQFTHQYFQKDQPELLRNIKRKATPSKASIENSNKHDELAKVLTDVKQLRGRQANVDSQLNAMKQENALLWREVAILRQKHLKQQKIVNKLIQFLVTLVQPSRMTVGVKRGYQLMLNESPSKKSKTDISKGNNNNNNAEGPTIHELDNELELSPNLYEEDTPLEESSSPGELRNETIDSPTASSASQSNEVRSPLSSALLNEDNGDSSSQVYWDKPDLVDIGQPSDLIDNNDIVEENLMNTLENESLSPTSKNNKNVNQKVFLNPTTQDTLLSNLIKNNSSSKNKKIKEDIEKDDVSQTMDKFSPPSQQTSSDSTSFSSMTVATRDQNLVDIAKGEDLSNHVESTQTELDQFKDILNNYNSYVDANALLGLFSDESPPAYDLIVSNDDKNENFIDSGTDPLVSGSELTPYCTSFDFTELFDDAIDDDPNTKISTSTNNVSSTVNTPQIIKEEPIFPITSKSLKK